MADKDTREDLKELHRMLCDSFHSYLEDPPNGNYTARMLEVIRAFLRDNNIKKDPETTADIKQSLKELSSMDIPFFPD
ncbi:hypothetical protein ACKVEX_09050 [Rhodocyclaceae bacterium SMB388]